MSIVRKSAVSEKIKKPRVARTRKVKINMDELYDAVVDGKFVVPIDGKIFFIRTILDKTAIHEGIVKKIHGDGVIDVFDLTRDQFFMLSLKQPNLCVKSETKYALEIEQTKSPVADDNEPTGSLVEENQSFQAQ